MPEYLIELINPTEEQKQEIEEHLKKQETLNEKMKKSRKVKLFSKLYEKSMGVQLDLYFEWKWKNDEKTKLKIWIQATAPIKESFYDRQIKSLRKIANVKILKNIKGEYIEI